MLRPSTIRVSVTHDAHLILLAGVLLAAGVGASLVASRLRLPALVLFLGVGMAVGSDGLGWIYLDDYSLARLVGTIALVAILYEGGLQTGLTKLRPVLVPASSLAIVGTALTALITGLAAASLLHFSIAEGLLLGAIMSPTDGAAVFALLRGVRLPQRLVLILEGEAGLNDPVAVMLVLVMIEVIRHGGYTPLDALWFIVHELAIGIVVGGAVGWLSAQGLRRLLPDAPAGLALVWSFATAALAYGAAASLTGSGFLAVYIAALVVGNAPIRQRPALTCVSRGTRGRRRDGDVLHARAAGVPQPARPCAGARDRARVRDRARRAAAGHLRGDGRLPLAACANGRCWAGRDCAGACRSCWRRCR